MSDALPGDALRMRPLLEGGGELVDRAFITVMLAGLRERVSPR